MRNRGRSPDRVPPIARLTRRIICGCTSFLFDSAYDSLMQKRCSASAASMDQLRAAPKRRRKSQTRVISAVRDACEVA